MSLPIASPLCVPSPGEGPERKLGSIIARSIRIGLLATVASLGLVAPSAAQFAAPSATQSSASPAAAEAPEQMLIEGDTLIYDNDTGEVSIVGAVRLAYQGNRLVADRVVYRERAGRLLAMGRVELILENGDRVVANEVDITDDFRDGFVSALRLETVDRRFFAARQAQRFDGELTIFDQAVYTACEPCRERPERPPTWRIRAQRIIWNGRERRVGFENPRFEFLGVPVFGLPYYETDDPTVKRKRGFLFPAIRYDSGTGYGLTIPYYIPFGQTAELLLQPTIYSKQGPLAEAVYNQRFDYGEISVTAAGIHQFDPDEFGGSTVDRETENRAMLGTKGEFSLSPNFVFGWDLLFQTDKNFSETYEIPGYSDSVRASETYLTGIGERNYFDLRFGRFQVQEDLPDRFIEAREPTQAYYLPDFEYERFDENIYGGQLRTVIDSRALYREENDLEFNDDDELIRIDGPEGSNERFSIQSEWSRRFVTAQGVQVTPFVGARGDVIGTQYMETAEDQIALLGNNIGQPIDTDPSLLRGMVKTGVEVSWPILFSAIGSSHIVEPIGQLIVRPDAAGQDRLGLPNEDAQSLVFSATNLFDHDKFSGYDRLEGGTRANVGLRYASRFDNGFRANAAVGQSFHLAGDNPYAAPDLVRVGTFSGLSDDVSDVVAQVGIGYGERLSTSLGARFDKEDASLERLSGGVAYSGDRLFTKIGYTYFDRQPTIGFEEERHAVDGDAFVKLTKTIGASVGIDYDITNDLLNSNYVGLTYEDSCFTFSATFSQSRDDRTETTNSVTFGINFRTLGGVRQSASLDRDEW